MNISNDIRGDNNFYKLQDIILEYAIKFTCHSKYTTLETKTLHYHAKRVNVI